MPDPLSPDPRRKVVLAFTDPDFRPTREPFPQGTCYAEVLVDRPLDADGVTAIVNALLAEVDRVMEAGRFPQDPGRLPA